MRLLIPLSISVLFALSCAQPDPRVQAARDFQETAYALIAKDEARSKRLNSLRVGMTDTEVLKTAGQPTRREGRKTSEGGVEVWTYNGELKMLGTLTFHDGRLAEITVP